MSKRKRLWVIPIIVTVIVAVVGVFATPSSMPGSDRSGVALAAGLEQPEEHCIHANQEQLGKVKELWGQDISEIELLEQVFPEVWEDIPQDTVELYQETMERGHAMNINWPSIKRGLEVKDLSDIDISWGVIDKEKVRFFWVNIDSNSGQIDGHVWEHFTVKKYKPSGEPGHNHATVIRDNAGRPTDIRVVNVTPEMEQAEEQARKESSAEPLETHTMHQWAEQVYHSYTPTGYSGVRMMQGFEWDGNNVVNAWDDGSYYSCLWPIYYIGQDYDSYPATPCWKHTIYGEVTFAFHPGGFWQHTHHVWVYGYGDGDTGQDFSFSHPGACPGWLNRDWSPK